MTVWDHGVNYSRGAFFDIGAFAPKTFSNTRALYELGWSGVMIEPSPMPMPALLQEYGKEPRITLICAAVGLERQMVKLNITQDAMSTSDPAWCEKWAKDGGYYGSMFVPQITLDDIFLQFGGGFDFVNIDTEGSSFSEPPGRRFWRRRFGQGASRSSMTAGTRKASRCSMRAATRWFMRMMRIGFWC